MNIQVYDDDYGTRQVEVNEAFYDAEGNCYHEFSKAKMQKDGKPVIVMIFEKTPVYPNIYNRK